MSVTTTDIPISLLGTQVVVSAVSSTPIQVFETPVPNGYSFMTFYDGNNSTHAGSVNILVTPSVPPITYNSDAKIFTDTSIYPFSWNLMYEEVQIVLYWDINTSSFYMVSTGATVTNVVIRRFLIPGPAYTSSNLYGIDRLQASNPAPNSAVTIRSPIVFNYTGSNALNFKQATVTQTTSLVTPVTINGSSGIITTVSATTERVAMESFTVNNTAVSATSVVLVSVASYDGTTLPPVVTSTNTVNGSFQVNVINLGGNDLNGVLKIAFLVC